MVRTKEQEQNGQIEQQQHKKHKLQRLPLIGKSPHCVKVSWLVHIQSIARHSYVKQAANRLQISPIISHSQQTIIKERLSLSEPMFTSSPLKIG